MRSSSGFKKVIKASFVLIIAVCLLYLPLFNQISTGSLTGYVYKRDGRTPLNNAQIVLSEIVDGDETGTVFRSNITDTTGEYKLENVTEGTYLIKIRVNNSRYRIKKIDCIVNITAGESNFVSFSLKSIR